MEGSEKDKSNYCNPGAAIEQILEDKIIYIWDLQNDVNTKDTDSISNPNWVQAYFIFFCFVDSVLFFQNWRFIATLLRASPLAPLFQ